MSSFLLQLALDPLCAPNTAHGDTPNTGSNGSLLRAAPSQKHLSTGPGNAHERPDEAMGVNLLMPVYTTVPSKS